MNSAVPPFCSNEDINAFLGCVAGGAGKGFHWCQSQRQSIDRKLEAGQPWEDILEELIEATSLPKPTLQNVVTWCMHFNEKQKHLKLNEFTKEQLDEADEYFTRVRTYQHSAAYNSLPLRRRPRDIEFELWMLAQKMSARRAGAWAQSPWPPLDQYQETTACVLDRMYTLGAAVDAHRAGADYALTVGWHHSILITNISFWADVKVAMRLFLGSEQPVEEQPPAWMLARDIGVSRTALPPPVHVEVTETPPPAVCFVGPRMERPSATEINSFVASIAGHLRRDHRFCVALRRRVDQSLNAGDSWERVVARVIRQRNLCPSRDSIAEWCAAFRALQPGTIKVMTLADFNAKEIKEASDSCKKSTPDGIVYNPGKVYRFRDRRCALGYAATVDAAGLVVDIVLIGKPHDMLITNKPETFVPDPIAAARLFGLKKEDGPTTVIVASEQPDDDETQYFSDHK